MDPGDKHFLPLSPTFWNIISQEVTPALTTFSKDLKMWFFFAQQAWGVLIIRSPPTGCITPRNIFVFVVFFYLMFIVLAGFVNCSNYWLYCMPPRVIQRRPYKFDKQTNKQRKFISWLDLSHLLGCNLLQWGGAGWRSFPWCWLLGSQKKFSNWVDNGCSGISTPHPPVFPLPGTWERSRVN